MIYIFGKAPRFKDLPFAGIRLMCRRSLRGHDPLRGLCENPLSSREVWTISRHVGLTWVDCGDTSRILAASAFSLTGEEEWVLPPISLCRSVNHACLGQNGATRMRRHCYVWLNFWKTWQRICWGGAYANIPSQLMARASVKIALWSGVSDTKVAHLVLNLVAKRSRLG